MQAGDFDHDTASTLLPAYGLKLTSLISIFTLPDEAFLTYALDKAVVEEEERQSSAMTGEVHLSHLLSVGRRQFCAMAVASACSNLLTADGVDCCTSGLPLEVRSLFTDSAGGWLKSPVTEPSGSGLFVTTAPLSSPLVLEGSPCDDVYDLAIFHLDSKTLTLVAVEADDMLLDIRATLLLETLRLLQEKKQCNQQGDEVIGFQAELWTTRENTALLSPLAASALVTSEGVEGSSLNLVGGARIRLVGDAPPLPPRQTALPIPSYRAALQRAAEEAAALSHAVGNVCNRGKKDPSTEPTRLTAQQLFPWVLAHQRSMVRALSTASSLQTALPANPTPLPSKDAPLFGAVVLPSVLRQGYTAVKGEQAVLPELVLSFINAKGAPVFKFDDEALEVLWKLVPGLRAAVAVYDEGQRWELVKRLHVWHWKRSGLAQSSPEAATNANSDIRSGGEGGQGLSLRDRQTLYSVLPSCVFSIVGGLRCLYEKETDCSTASSSAASAPPNGESHAGQTADPAAVVVDAFVQTCDEDKVWRFNVRQVLSRSGILSLRPVPPITKVKAKRPTAAASVEERELNGASGAEASTAAYAFEPSVFPESFLSFVLALMSSDGVDKCESVSYDVLRTMKRLVSRQ